MDLLAKLRRWFHDEWGHIDSFSGNHDKVAVPAPLVAVDEHHRLLGGLAFSSFPKPDDGAIAVWVNALLVAPEHRSHGIASALLASAEAAAQRLHIPELFVFTESPGLYQKCGWAQVTGHEQGASVVLRRMLPRR